MKATRIERPFVGLPPTLRKYLPRGYMRMVRRILPQYSKSYIYKVCEGWKASDEVMNAIILVALANKANENKDSNNKKRRRNRRRRDS
jgi:hypothetical protein